MSGAGSALMGIGSARGEGRAIQAAEKAINSPLLEASMDGAHGALLSIAGGSDLGLFEINEAASLVQESAHPDANIIFGTIIDDSLGDEVRVTVIAAGFDAGAPTHKKLDPSTFGSRTRLVRDHGVGLGRPVRRPPPPPRAPPAGAAGRQLRLPGRRGRRRSHSPMPSAAGTSRLRRAPAARRRLARLPDRSAPTRPRAACPAARCRCTTTRRTTRSTFRRSCGASSDWNASWIRRGRPPVRYRRTRATAAASGWASDSADFSGTGWTRRAGIRRVVTTRAGGASRPPYDSFNLGDHVGDDEGKSTPTASASPPNSAWPRTSWPGWNRSTAARRPWSTARRPAPPRRPTRW